MVSRRAFVAGLGLGAVGLWGVQNVDSEDIPDINNDTLANSPDEKEVLKTAEFEKLIQELTFYSNGEVDILLKEDHGCYRSIEFGHSKSDEQYTDWTAPEFAGPKTVPAAKRYPRAIRMMAATPIQTTPGANACPTPSKTALELLNALDELLVPFVTAGSRTCDACSDSA